MKKYRANTFGMTLQQRLDSEKKKTEEKLKGLGPQTLRVTLTDYLKSPPLPPSMNQRSQVAMYFESFCQSLDVEEPSSSSFLDMLNQQNMTMTNLDFGQTSTMDHPVWDADTNQWLDELIAQLEEPPPPETADSCRVAENHVMDWLDDLIGDLEDPSSSLENTVDVRDLFHDVENKVDWEHVLNDVLDQFDCDLLS